jgi:hypothetical protein
MQLLVDLQNFRSKVSYANFERQLPREYKR